MPAVDAFTPTPTPTVPRKRGRPPKVDSADGGRRMDLIAAAARHFRDKGFDATTTRDIASATGMQSGSPFYHFKSKHELLFAIMDAGMQNAHRSQAAVLATLPAGTRARDVLQALVLNHLYVLWLPGNDFVPVMIYEWRSLTATHRLQVQSLKDSYEQPWREVLQQLADAGQLGTGDASLSRSMLFGVMHGSLHWFKPKGRLSLEALAQQCVNALVFPAGTVAPTKASRASNAIHASSASSASSASKASSMAFDPVAVVRQANGLLPLSASTGAVPAESPLSKHVGPHAGKAAPAPRAPRAAARASAVAPAQPGAPAAGVAAPSAVAASTMSAPSAPPNEGLAPAKSTARAARALGAPKPQD